MATGLFVNTTPLEDLVENYNTDNSDIQTSVYSKLSSYNYLTSDDRLFITADKVPSDLEGIWGSVSYTSGYRNLNKEIPFVKKGSAPLPYRPDAQNCTNWGSTKVLAGESRYFRYNSSTGWIQRATNSSFSSGLTNLKQGNCIWIDMVGGGGGGGGSDWFVIIVVPTCDPAGGGGSGAFISACIDLSKTGYIQVYAGAGGSGGAAGDNTGGAPGQASYIKFPNLGSSYALIANGGSPGKRLIGGDGGTYDVSNAPSKSQGVYCLANKTDFTTTSCHDGLKGGNDQESSASYSAYAQIRGVVTWSRIRYSGLRGYAGSPYCQNGNWQYPGGGGAPSMLGMMGMTYTGTGSYGNGNNPNPVGYGYGGAGGPGSQTADHEGLDGGAGVVIIHY